MFHELLVQEIKAATVSVFSTMLGMDVIAGEPESDSVWGPASGVVALVGIAGRYCGTGSVNCRADLACQVSGRMLMCEYSDVNADVLDAMGEIANMVVGNIKATLEERFGPMGLSTPTVLSGEKVTSKALTKAGWTMVPFTWEGQRFSVQMALSECSVTHGVGDGAMAGSVAG